MARSRSLVAGTRLNTQRFAGLEAQRRANLVVSIAAGALAGNTVKDSMLKQDTKAID